MVNDFLTYLGLQFKQEGSQLVIDCPQCGKEKHCHVAPDNGLWHCKVCGAKGNPYRMVGFLNPQFDAHRIFEILERFDLHHSDNPTAKNKKSTSPKITQADIREITDSELDTICEIKKIDKNSLLKFDPWAHINKPWMLLPAFSPENLEKACGWMRIHLTGENIFVGYDNHRQPRMEKYPIISGSVHGLFGLKCLMQEQPQTIIFAEGWRDALAAISLGYAATASSGGASKWDDSWLPVFKDKNVYVIMDRDDAGVNAAQRAAFAIFNVAKSVKVIELPYELKKDHGSDLYDYICKDGHTKTDLDKLLSDTKQWMPEDDETESSTDNNEPGKSKFIILENDHVDTFSKAFEKWSIEKCDVRHRYNSIDGWSIFNKNRYQHVPDEVEIEKYVRHFIADEVRIKKRVKQEDGTFTYVKNKPDSSHKSRGFVSNIMAWLRDSDSVHLLPSQAAPCSLNGMLDPRFIIPLRNGLLDWSTYPYRFFPLSEDFYTFNYLPFDWNGLKDSELWIRYVVEATDCNEELHDMLQQWYGYCLMKHDQKEQKFLLLYGEAKTGKSVYCDVLVSLLGINNCSTVPLSKFSEAHYTIQTYGKMLNVSDESSKMLEEEVETALKHYTGGTPFNFKRLYQEPFSAYPTAKIMIATNNLPRFGDTSEGIWRRMLLAPFTRTVPENERIKGLAEKIKATEMGGVLKWALEGARKLIKNGGFVEPQICKQELERYKKEVHPEYVFLDENFKSCENLPELSVRCDVLRSCYNKWCELHGHRPVSDTRLGHSVRKMFPSGIRKRARKSGTLTYIYEGVCMTIDSEFYTEVV